MATDESDSDAGPEVEPTKAEMAQWDIDRRLKRIQQIYLLHPGAKRVMQQLDFAWEHGMRLRETSTAFIMGNSRCGKTETLKQFIRRKTGKPFPNDVGTTSMFIEGKNSRIVFLDCTNGATPLQASISVLKNLFQFHLKITENQASEKLIHHFGMNEVDMFIIDEGQKMIGTGAASNSFANWILSMENARKFRIVVAGGPELKQLMDSHPTIRDRKDSFVHLEPFAHRSAADRTRFRAFLRNFDLKMPFLSTPLVDPTLDDAIYYATRGRPGTLAKLLEKATMFAFERAMPKVLGKEHLSRAFALSFSQESRMFGVNPFEHKGALPTIPRSLAEEMSYVTAVPALRRSPRRRGSRLANLA